MAQKYMVVVAHLSKQAFELSYWQPTATTARSRPLSSRHLWRIFLRSTVNITEYLYAMSSKYRPPAFLLEPPHTPTRVFHWCYAPAILPEDLYLQDALRQKSAKSPNPKQQRDGSKSGDRKHILLTRKGSNTSPLKKKKMPHGYCKGQFLILECMVITSTWKHYCTT